MWYKKANMLRPQATLAYSKLEHRIVLPQRPRYKRPLLLLHGAWHGAWCWQQAAKDLAERGFEVHSMSLRGHGTSPKAPSWLAYSLDNYLRDLDSIVSQTEPRPIVVAHSLGGFVLQHYLETQSLPGAVLLCAMPAIHFPLNPLRFFLSDRKALFRTLLSGNSRHFFQSEAATRAAFFRPDSDPAIVQSTQAQLVSESLRVFLDAILRRVKPLQEPKSILVIAAEADKIFPISEQQALTAWYKTEANIIPAAAHDLMLDPAWSQAADLIESHAALWL